MLYATYSVQRWLFQFDIDSSFKLPIFSGQDVYIAVLKGMIFLLKIKVVYGEVSFP